MAFDGTSLCPSDVWDEKSVYPGIESSFPFKLHMNDVFAEAFNSHSTKKVTEVRF